MIERDYIMRMVQQLAGVLARLFKFKEQQAYDQALQEIDQAYGELFGMEAQMVGLFDPATLAQLLGHYEKIKAMAGLFFEQAELHRLNNEHEKAQRHSRRALEMMLEALLLKGEPDAETREKVQALLKIDDNLHLSDRYVDALRRHQFSA